VVSHRRTASEVAFGNGTEGHQGGVRSVSDAVRPPCGGGDDREALDSEGKVASDMGVFDNMKDKVTGAVDDHGDKISDGLDKAGDAVDEKTGGKYGDKIDQGTDKAKDGLDSLDGQDDDIS
jgi:hypothetical protein